MIEGLVLGIVICGVAFMLWEVLRRRGQSLAGEAARGEAERIIQEAKGKSELLVKEAELKAKDMVVGARAETERELKERRRELTALETKLESREETLDKRLEAFERRETDLNRRDQVVRNREKAISDKEAEHQALIDEARNRLEAVAGLTREEAKRTLMDEMIGQARHEATR